jgi:hypothetical protein
MELLVESTGRQRVEVPLQRGLLTIGRGSDCDLVLDEPQASRRHAELRRFGDHWLIVDLNSTNGTTLGGQRLPPERPTFLPVGQPVVIGSTSLTLAEPGGAGEPELRWPVASAGLDTLPDVRLSAAGPWETTTNGGSREGADAPVVTFLRWTGRIVVTGGALLLVLSNGYDWIRVLVRLPLVGTVLDRSFGGLSSGHGWLLLAAAVLAMLLVLVDILSPRWGVAAGLGQALIGFFTALSLAVTVYSYYQAGSQTLFGIDLLDVFAQYARNLVTVTIEPGIYMVGLGLAGLTAGGLVRLVSAGMQPTQ